ncbi:glycosyltransferase [Streptomyces kaniharaensis]|uniref:Glycosyltransferase n=1 Tax=Streptomyces kaniharaensis TaxID=212423 RepID=A0A6N7KWQ7_9ACTN|nr:glycosyltransferase [Streptomyces kaniharaensis]MQS15205.1 glycosyltransferase [Streptomyces kaniharaensis]
MPETIILPSAPVQVAELDLERPTALLRPGGDEVLLRSGRVLALIRRQGRPLGLVTAEAVPGDPDGLCRALVAEAYRRLDLADRDTVPPRPPADPPLVSVVVCTHNRVDLLPRALDALLGTAYPRIEVIVVDSAPANQATDLLVRLHYHGRVRYVREPVPGLARARNRGLAAARGEICAFADDDLILDAGWVPALVDGFRSDDRVGCVTGLVLPAELDTEAQIALERYAGYSKGFTARSWSLRDRSDDPLFPFATGRLGTGANMAFRTDVLRAIGGFDPATSTGTPAMGGEDLLSFLQVLAAGHKVAYRPDALVWHPHRRGMDSLTTQVFGFGVGFGAYLTAAVARQPRLLASLVPRVPRGIWQTLHRGDSVVGPRDPLMAHLRRRELLGLLYGPICYVRSARLQTRARAARP